MTNRNDPARPATWLALIGLVLALGLPELRLGTWLAPGDTIPAQLARELIWWLLAGLVLGWVLFAERQTLASIGLRRPRRATFGWALVATIALMASAMLGYALILPALGLEMNRTAVASITQQPLWLQLCIFVRAGVVEEILYRGYAIERLTLLTGSRWLAALLPAVFFIAVHYAFWGVGQLVVVTLATLILTALYLWRRDLPCCMIAHALADTIGFTLARLQS